MRNQAGNVSFIGSFPTGWPVLGLPEIAFAGRSNVGKSSALNRLLNNFKAARVSSTPGRTQAINLFQLGRACAFADLPGYGFAKVPPAMQAQWKEMVEDYFSNREELKLVVVLVDARREPQEMDGQLLYGLTEAHIPTLVVATKVDKLKANERRASIAALRKEFHLRGDQCIPFSSVTGEGKNLVWDAIEAACGGKSAPE